jgi:hypothetical protein
LRDGGIVSSEKRFQVSKKEVRQKKKPSAVNRARTNRRKAAMAVALILSLCVAAVILAGRRTTRSLPALASPLPPQSSTPQLSKEYVYAGGRLIATEEPGNGAPLVAPTNFTAHADATTQITLSWASTGAPGYLVEWSTNFAAANNGFTQRTTVDCAGGCPNTLSYTDTVPAGTVTTYLYRVRSISGAQQSAPSAFDFATTKSFQEQIQNQIPPGRTTVKAIHFLELRDAVNAVRAAAGLNAFTWSDPQGRVPANNVPILKSHMQDLRNGLDQALSSMGLTPQAYTDQGLPPGTSVQKVHIDELRQRTKSVGQ